MSDSNKQVIFNAVVRHLLTQNQKAVEPLYTDGVISSGCRYRAKSGLKCAIGGIIADALYRLVFEGNAVDTSYISCAVGESLGITVGKEDILLLLDLQGIHDREPPELWRERLQETANDNALTMPAEFAA